jgi:hypothetical protein
MTRCPGETLLFIRLAVLVSYSLQYVVISLEMYHEHMPYFPSITAV